MKEAGFEQPIKEPCAIALGFFDSVHMGHRRILERVVDFKKKGLKAAVFTFGNNAYRQFNPDSKLIYTFEERKTIFENLGLDYVFSVKFDQFFKEIPAREFLDRLLKTANIKAAACGYDYLFGRGGEGDTELLSDFCYNRGIELFVENKLEFRGERVSSSLIKNLILSGKVEEASELLTRSFFVDGEVGKGYGVGRTFGVPTANLVVHSEKLLPAPGVYGTSVNFMEKSYSGVTNVGSRPTFGDSRKGVETFIQDFSGNLYGKVIRVEFIKRLRDVRKFDSVEELKVQITEDLKWREC